MEKFHAWHAIPAAFPAPQPLFPGRTTQRTIASSSLHHQHTRHTPPTPSTLHHRPWKLPHRHPNAEGMAASDLVGQDTTLSILIPGVVWRACEREGQMVGARQRGCLATGEEWDWPGGQVALTPSSCCHPARMASIPGALPDPPRPPLVQIPENATLSPELASTPLEIGRRERGAGWVDGKKGATSRVWVGLPATGIRIIIATTHPATTQPPNHPTAEAAAAAAVVVI